MSHGDPGHAVVIHWVEIVSAAVCMGGFLIALIIGSAFLNYVVIFLSGLLAGRIIYEKYLSQPIFPYIMIFNGLFLGYMLGAVTANKKIIVVLFWGAVWLSHWAHKKGYIGFFRSTLFIK